MKKRGECQLCGKACKVRKGYTRNFDELCKKCERRFRC